MFNQRTNPLYIRLKEIVFRRGTGQDAAGELDHHHLVAPAGLL
jgi:hypothetical protein